MPFKRLEPAGGADQNAETEGHMPVKRGLEPAGGPEAETEGHMPLKRGLEPAGDADAEGHKFIPRGERDGEAEGLVAKAGRIQPATEGRTTDLPAGDGEAEGHAFRRG